MNYDDAYRQDLVAKRLPKHAPDVPGDTGA